LPDGDGGRFGECATSQSYADFRADGPRVSGAPARVLAALRAWLDEG
jgi:hypothetical protein